MTDLWQHIFDILSNVNGIIPLVAVTVGLLLFVVFFRHQVPRSVLVVIVILILAVDVTYVVIFHTPPTYHVRVTVVDPQGRAADDAKVITKSGSEALKVPGGYQFDISSDKLPPDHKIEFIATEDFYTGEGQVVIGSNKNPAITIQLAPKTDNVMVAGMVEDTGHRGVEGALVSVVGAPENIVTKPGGGFVLAAHAPFGKQVLLHAEKKGYPSIDQWEKAGNQQILLVLKR